MTLSGAIAKPLFGTLADYLNPRLVMGLSLLLQVLGVLLLLVTVSYPVLLLAAVVFGLGYGAVMTMWGVQMGLIYGREAFSRVMGVMSPMILPFNLAGLPISTYVFEASGSYLGAYTGLLGGFMVSGIALLLLRVPTRSV
jgi:MFS family permease